MSDPKDALIAEKLANFKELLRAKATKGQDELKAYESPEMLRAMAEQYLKPMHAAGTLSALAGTLCDLAGIDGEPDRVKVGRYLQFLAEAI